MHVILLQITGEYHTPLYLIQVFILQCAILRAYGILHHSTKLYYRAVYIVQAWTVKYNNSWYQTFRDSLLIWACVTTVSLQGLVCSDLVMYYMNKI